MRPCVQVRPAEPEDLPGLVALCLAAREESSSGPQLCSPDAELVAQQLGALASVPDGTVLVARSDDGVVGFLLARTVGPNLFTDTAGFSVEAVYVLPELRRRGTGHALMAAAVDAAAAAGAEQVYVAPLPGTRGMQRFLVRLGFGPAATHRVATTASLQRRLAHDGGGARRPRSLEELIARRRESRRRAHGGTTLDALSARLDVVATGTDGAPAPQRASSSMQESRAVQMRRDSSSSTTIS